MKKYSAVAVTLLVCCGMALTAHAQQEGKVVVTVPCEFIAGSKTLPAGTYTIGRLSLDTGSPLLISNRTNSSFVLPLSLTVPQVIRSGSALSMWARRTYSAE